MQAGRPLPRRRRDEPSILRTRFALHGLCALVALAWVAPAEAQVLFKRRPPPVATSAPPGTPPAEAEIWPFPPPDPKSWWDDERPKLSEAADPLGGRKLGRRERLVPIDNGVEPTVYRLWGLPPLQTQVLRGDEMILEVWVRPARSVRQAVVRVTVRRDGQAFVQARAGLACCEPGIARRIGFDAELTSGAAARFPALRSDPLWDAPREVRVEESGASTEAVCVDGTSYDLTLVVPGRSRSVRRACDNAEIGEAAEPLEAALTAALGHDPRFDVLFPGGASYAAARDAYQDLTREGGRLKPDPNSRAQPPGFTPEPEEAPSAGEAPPAGPS